MYFIINQTLYEDLYLHIFCVVLQDFCKLALDLLQKGPTPKLYQTAARK